MSRNKTNLLIIVFGLSLISVGPVATASEGHQSPGVIPNKGAPAQKEKIAQQEPAPQAIVQSQPTTPVAPKKLQVKVLPQGEPAAEAQAGEEVAIKSDRIPYSQLLSNKIVEKISVKLLEGDQQNAAEIKFNVFKGCAERFGIEQVMPNSIDNESSNQAGFSVVDKEGEGRRCVTELQKRQNRISGAGTGCSNVQIKKDGKVEQPFACEQIVSRMDLSQLSGKVQIGVFSLDANFNPEFAPVKDAIYTDPSTRAAERAEKLAVEKAKKIEEAKKLINCETCTSDKMQAAFKELMALGELKDKEESELTEIQTKITARKIEELAKQVKPGKSNDSVRKELLEIAKKDPRMAGDVATIFAQIASDFPSRDIDRLFEEMKELNQVATSGEGRETHDAIAHAMKSAAERVVNDKENPKLGDYKKYEKLLKSINKLAGVSSDTKREMAKEISTAKGYQFQIMAAGNDTFSIYGAMASLQTEARNAYAKSCGSAMMGPTKVNDNCAIAKETYGPLMQNVPKIIQNAQIQKARAAYEEQQAQTALMNSFNNPGLTNYGLFNANQGIGGLNNGNQSMPQQSQVPPYMQQGLTLR